MIKVCDILEFLEDFAPYSLAENWDNCGLLVGDGNLQVNGVLCSLDVTHDVIDEAIFRNCNLIIAHHPIIFTSVKSVTTLDNTGSMIIKAIKNDISIICMHTNLDTTIGGVNDALANKLYLKNIYTDESVSMGRIGYFENEEKFEDVLDYIKMQLNANGLKYVGKGTCKKVAVLGGAGGKLLDFAIRNKCDTYITSDCSYDVFQKAQNFGINLIDAGHFATENVIVEIIANKIFETFNINTDISESHTDIINFR